MKRSILTIVAAWLSCQGVAAATFTITGNQRLDLLGSQFAVNDTAGSYLTLPSYANSSAPPDTGDEVFIWDRPSQSFTYFNYTGFLWDLYDPAVTRGTAFFYRRNLNGDTANRVVSSSLPAPVPVPPLQPGFYYALSGQNPGPATYQDLMGNLAAIPLPRTFVWRWSPLKGDFNTVYRFTTSGGWDKLLANSSVPLVTPSTAPNIPAGEGAFVAYFTPDAAPTIQEAHAIGVTSGCGAAEVILTVTFSKDVDPIEAANVGNYGIYLAGSGCTTAGNCSGGIVTSVSFPDPLPFGVTPALRRVQLHVTLVTASTALCPITCPNYFVKAPGVTSMGGTAIGGADPGKSFTPFVSCVAANDNPDNAEVLNGAPNAVDIRNGSLACATPNNNAVYNVRTYPTDSAQRRDVWFRYTPDVPGCVTLDNCTPAANCPTRTVVAVYQGNPADLKSLVPIEVHIPFNPAGLLCDNRYWNNTRIMPPPDQPQLQFFCPDGNPHAPFVFPAKACHNYYIRVSLDKGFPPGDFTLSLKHDARANLNDTCISSYQNHLRLNNEIFFDNFGSTGNALFPNDVWLRFDPFSLAFAGTPITLDVCRSTFSSPPKLDVYLKQNPGIAGCDDTPLTLLAPTSASCSANAVTFNAVNGGPVFVRVSSPELGRCGFLRITTELPPLPTAAPCRPLGITKQNTYRLIGRPNLVSEWSWSLTAPVSVNFAGMNIAGNVMDSDVDMAALTHGDTALAVAVAFAKSINDANINAGNNCTVTPIAAPQPSNSGGAPSPDVAFLHVRTDCNTEQVVLQVAPLSGTPSCWVHNTAFLGSGGGPLTPCVFNPSITEIAVDLADADDCNTNGVADYMDILTGDSTDSDADGVPDECQSCVRVSITDDVNSANVVVGGNAQFGVTVAGTPPFSYQWFKGAVALPGQTNSQLAFTNVAFEDTGFYHVMVSNACGQAQSDVGVLAVSRVPLFPVQPTLSQIIRLGNGTVRLTFTNATGSAFTVFSSTNIALPLVQWTALGAPSPIAPGVYEFTDLTATNFQQRFYIVGEP